MKFLYFVPLFLSYASSCLAQDSFSNPYNSSYVIEHSSEYYTDSICGKLVFTYDRERHISYYCQQYNDGRKTEGIVLDKQLDLNRQVFKLHKYFKGKFDANMTITRSNANESQKVAFIYYADPNDDIALEKTCIFMILDSYDSSFNTTNN